MRITNGMLITNMMRNLSKNMQKLDKLQNQLASGKRVRVPSDDPVATSKALKIRTDLAQNEQYIKNADNALSWLETTEAALRELGDVLHRVRELTVEAANGTYNQEDLNKIADEIEQLQKHVVQIGNTTYAGRYIFAGYKTDKPPFTLEAGSIIYNGDNGKIAFEIGIGNRIEINVLGSDGGAEIDKMFEVLENLKDDLRSGSGNISGYLARLDERMNVLLAQRSAVGAKMNRFEFIRARLTDEKINFSRLLSETEDVDIAQVIVELKEAENVYRSSLAVGARIIMPTLIDFLK